MDGGIGRGAAPIVCGVDASTEARHALRLAQALGHRLGLELVLAHVVADGDLAGGAAVLEQLAADEVVAEVRLRCETGDVAATLVDVARDEHAALLVVGSAAHGRLHAAVHGSVPLAVATRAPCPVLVAALCARIGPFREATAPIVCAVGDDGRALDALRVADALATSLEAPLVLVHVAPSPHVPGTSAVPGAADELARIEREDAHTLLSELAAEAHAEGVTAQRVLFGSAGRALAELAAREAAALVVVGSRGRGPVAAALLGSVSAELMAAGGCPVLVVPPTASVGTGRAASHVVPAARAPPASAHAGALCGASSHDGNRP